MVGVSNVSYYSVFSNTLVTFQSNYEFFLTYSGVITSLPVIQIPFNSRRASTIRIFVAYLGGVHRSQQET